MLGEVLRKQSVRIGHGLTDDAATGRQPRTRGSSTRWLRDRLATSVAGRRIDAGSSHWPTAANEI